MSKQVSFSVAICVLVMAAFTLSATAPGSATPFGTGDRAGIADMKTGAETLVPTPVIDLSFFAPAG